MNNVTIKSVLEAIKSYIEEKTWDKVYFKSIGNDNGFENLFKHIAPVIADKFKGIKIDIIGGHHFPDVNIIIADKKYGVELKSSQKGTWIVPGNSIFESISEDDYEQIFVMFASRRKDTITKKFIFKYAIKYKEYWQSTSNISVTHSPRFIINMDTASTVFSSVAEYIKFRDMTNEEKALFAQKILRERADGIKWYIAPDIDSIKVTNFSELTKERKQELITELFVLFPTDILRKRNEYSRCTNYLIDKYYIYSKNLRDVFSAGGRLEINGVFLPQTLRTFIEYEPSIKELIENANEDFQLVAYSCWGIVKKIDFYSDFQLVVDNWVKTEFKKELSELQVSSIFDL